MKFRITMELVSSCVLWLNLYPRKSGVSDTMIHRNIITGLMIGYNKNYKLLFGEYVKTNVYHDKSNGTARTIGDLYLNPTVNDQGGYYFYSLRTIDGNYQAIILFSL